MLLAWEFPTLPFGHLSNCNCIWPGWLPACVIRDGTLAQSIYLIVSCGHLHCPCAIRCVYRCCLAHC